MSFQINEDSINQIGKILANDYEEQKLLDFQNSVIKVINGQYSLLRKEFDTLNSEIRKLKDLLGNSGTQNLENRKKTPEKTPEKTSEKTPEKTPEKTIKVKASKSRKSADTAETIKKTRKSNNFKITALSINSTKGKHLYELMCLTSEEQIRQLDFTTLRFSKRVHDMCIPSDLLVQILGYFNKRNYLGSLTLGEITNFYKANPKLVKDTAWSPNTLCIYYKSALQMLTELGYLKKVSHGYKKPSMYMKTNKSYSRVRILEA